MAVVRVEVAELSLHPYGVVAVLCLVPLQRIAPHPTGLVVSAEGSVWVAQLLGIAPTCVHLTIDKPGIVTKTVWLTNYCSETVRVRVDISFSPDLPCVTLTPGRRASWKIPRSAVVAGVNNC